MLASFKSRYEFKGFFFVFIVFQSEPTRGVTAGMDDDKHPVSYVISCVCFAFCPVRTSGVRSTRTRQTTRARAVVNFEKPRESVWLSRRSVLLRQPIAHPAPFGDPIAVVRQTARRPAARCACRPGIRAGKGRVGRHVSDFCFYSGCRVLRPGGFRVTCTRYGYRNAFIFDRVWQHGCAWENSGGRPLKRTVERCSWKKRRSRRPVESVRRKQKNVRENRQTE